MDRTIIAVQRAEERELGERLYKKLQGLALLHPPTDEFYKCFSEEMFLKPNQQAFFHVMHFLFCLLDPMEFKKRFYWPITDKQAESNFRTSTMEYLKHLNEKHQLQWGDIKSYLVVLPGGKKFITFLLELVGFVVQEQIKQHERQLNAEVEAGQFSEVNLRRMRCQNAFFKEYASAYLSEMDEQIAIRKNETAKLQQHLHTLAQETGVSMSLLTDAAWQEEWAQHNAQLFAERYTKYVAEITSLEEPLEKLKQVVNNFHTKEAELKYDKASVRQALQKIRERLPHAMATAESDVAAFVHPGGVNTTVEVTGEDDIKLHVLVDAFNAIAPTLSSVLQKSMQLPSCSEFVTAELISLKQELEQIECQITDFQKMLNKQQRKRNTRKQVLIQHTPVAPTLPQHGKDSGALQLKFVYTPPIKLDVFGDERTAKLRLPLFDSVNTKPNETINSFLAVPRSARRPRAGEYSFDHNNSTLNKSKIVDPMELLRTISKGTARKYRTDHNASSTLGVKWRERQRLLHTELEVAPLTAGKTNSQQSKSKVEEGSQPYGSTSPCTPFNTKEHTTIARKHLLEGISSSSGSGGAAAVGTKVFYARKVAAVKKVHDDSLNIANMSISPSGRLDALVSMDIKEGPKLKVNDITMQEETIILNASLDRGCVEVRKSSTTHLLLTTEQPPVTDENDINVVNLLPTGSSATPTITNLSRALDEDDIFNISDSVLKDVIM